MQSRPVQIGTVGFVNSIATFLDTAGYLSRAQRESLEDIMKRTKWEMPDALPPSIDDRGERLLVYLTPGCHPGVGYLEGSRERYTPLGKTGIRCMHDPIYKALLDPFNPMTGLHRLLTSCGNYELAGTGRGPDKREHAESAKVLNASVSPALSTPDTDYVFRNAKVTGKSNSSGWLVFAERTAKG